MFDVIIRRLLLVFVILSVAVPAWAGGIGVQLEQRPWGVVVLNVFPGSPAAGAAIRPEDVIVAVNGVPVTDVVAAVDRIRGDDGTTAHLDLRRGEATLSVDLVRAPTSPPTVGSVPLTLAPGPDGLLVITANGFGDGWGGLRVGDAIVSIDNVSPTSRDDAMARLAGADQSDVQITIVRRVGDLAHFRVPRIKTYTVARNLLPPDAVSPAEKAYRSEFVAKFAAAKAGRRAAEDEEAFAAHLGREGRQYIVDSTRAARIALGTSKPRPVEPEDHFCRNLFALVLDYDERFAATRGDVVQPYEKDDLRLTLGEGVGTRYFLRADLPGFYSQSLWVSSNDAAYYATVREEVSMDEAKPVLREVARKIGQCNGSLMAPNYPIQLLGGMGSDDTSTAVWLVLRGTGPYAPDAFQLVLNVEPILGVRDAFRLTLSMASKLRQ